MNNHRAIDWKSFPIVDTDNHDWLLKLIFDEQVESKGVSKLCFHTYQQQSKKFQEFEVTHEEIDKALKRLHIMSDESQIHEIMEQIYEYVGTGGETTPKKTHLHLEFEYHMDGQRMSLKMDLEDDLKLTLLSDCSFVDDTVPLHEELLNVSGRYLEKSQFIINELVELIYDKVEALHECRDVLTESGRIGVLERLVKSNPETFDNFHYKEWIKKLPLGEYESNQGQESQLRVIGLDPDLYQESPVKKSSPLKVYLSKNMGKPERIESEFVEPTVVGLNVVKMPFVEDSSSSDDDDFELPSSPLKKKRKNRPT